MSANVSSKTPPVGGVLWPHEVAFLIFFAVAYYFSGPEFRGMGSLPLLLFGATIIAAVGLLIYRSWEEWVWLPNKVYFFVLAGAWVLLFVYAGNSTLGYVHTPSMFGYLFDAYTSPQAEDQHGLLIPFVVLLLFWWKREELLAQPAKFWWPAALFVVAGLLGHVLFFMVQQTKMSLIAFLVGLYGLTGLAWGRHWLRASLFPFFLLLFCIPVGEAGNWLTLRLRLLVSGIVYAIAHLGLAPDLIRDGTQLFDAQHTFSYEVAAACSGIHSLAALLALTTVYGFATFKKPWQRVALVLSALPIAVLGNVIRLCFTIMVAEAFGQDAGKAVETKFGFITLLVAVFCIFLLSKWLERFSPEVSQPEQPDQPVQA